MDIAGAAKRKYAIGFMKRHDAGVQEAKKLLESLKNSGELGRIVLMRAYCFGGEFTVGSANFAMTEEIRPQGLELWPEAPDWFMIPSHGRASCGMPTAITTSKTSRGRATEP